MTTGKSHTLSDMSEPGGNRSLDDEQIRFLISRLDQRIDDMHDHLAALRASDQLAVTVAYNGVSERMQGFPQQYATKPEMEAARDALVKLEKDAVPREMYDQQHGTLVDATTKLAREKLDEAVFNTFQENYRIEQARSASERRDVADVLARATDSVRQEVASERGEYLTIESYDQQHSAVVNQIDAVERWQYKLIGALVFATFVAPLVTGTFVYFITQGS
jgi:hypothetical protein